MSPPQLQKQKRAHSLTLSGQPVGETAWAYATGGGHSSHNLSCFLTILRTAKCAQGSAVPTDENDGKNASSGGSVKESSESRQPSQGHPVTFGYGGSVNPETLTKFELCKKGAIATTLPLI